VIAPSNDREALSLADPTTLGTASLENGAKLSSGLRCPCCGQVVEDLMG